MALFLKDKRQVMSLPVESIQPNPNQPRSIFSQAELQELSHSISQLGILQPLTVRKVGDGWELISGERRLRAAQMAGMTTVPCLVVQTDGETSSLLALVENIQRRDLDVWEEAIALRRLITIYHLSQDEVARRVGKSQSAVANKLRLLKLPPDVLALLRERHFTERHARALLRLESEEQQRQAAQVVVEQALTVARTEEYVESLLHPPERAARKSPVFLLKDVRLFLNSVTKGLTMMKSAGVDAACDRTDTDDSILLTIRIPKRSKP